MIELAAILLRLTQYSAASVLMGSALFFVYALPAQGPGSAAALRWPKPLLAGSAVLLAAGALFGLVVQTATLTGSLADALTSESLAAVVSQMDLGKAAIARAALALGAAIYILLVPPGRTLWLGAGLLGALACATIGWMGHGAATDGGGRTLHLGADIAHVLSAAMWIGALAGFVGLVTPRRQEFARLSATAEALRRFSPIGIALVAIVAASGLVNAWFLIGPNVAAALRDTYGRLLALKLVLFAAMLALAAVHRHRAVPALAARISFPAVPEGDALSVLRRTLLAEALLGFGIMAAVAWLGTLAPPGAM